MRVGDASSELSLARNGELAGLSMSAGMNDEQINVLGNYVVLVVRDEGGTEAIDRDAERHSQPCFL